MSKLLRIAYLCGILSVAPRGTATGEEQRMSARNGTWVVYLITIHGKPTGLSAVCEQDEWDAMERATPGHHTLVRSGIATEAEAEKLARGTSGDRPPRLKTRS